MVIKIEKIGNFVLFPGVVDALLDLGEGRLKLMDDEGHRICKF